MNLENDGERMDICYYSMDYDKFDIYQKSHYQRYKFAQSLLTNTDKVGDMACGSGYGSLMMSEKCDNVVGYDIDNVTICEISNRYKDEKNVQFHCMNLLNINDDNIYDVIVSFETLEHFEMDDIRKVIDIYHKALKGGGSLLFSTPYNQEDSIYSRKHHKTFHITEPTLSELLSDKFEIKQFYYQDYSTHYIKGDDGDKNFIICLATKK